MPTFIRLQVDISMDEPRSQQALDAFLALVRDRILPGRDGCLGGTILTGLIEAPGYAPPYRSGMAITVTEQPLGPDYQKLLRSYMQHVFDCEGATYIGSIGHRPSSVLFTGQEVRALLAINEEVKP